MKVFIISGLLLLTGGTSVAQSSYSPPAARLRKVRPAAAPVARVTAPGDHLTLAVRQNWRNGQWRDTTRNRYTRFDAADNNLERYVEDIDATGSWALRNRRTNTYNALNQRVRDSIFSNLNNPLFAFRRSYLATGQPDSVVVQLRLGGMWRYASRDIYTYDAAGHPQQQLQQNNAGGWYNFARYTYTTDALGRIVVDEEEYFDDNTGSWYPNSELVYTYTAADSLATAIYSEVSTTSGSYEPVGRSRYRYTAGGLLDSIYNEPYDAATGTFSLGNIATYTYDARANRLSELVQLGTSPTNLVNASRWVYSYSLATGRGGDLLTNVPLALVPNPAAGRAALHYELHQPATVGVEIVDLLGRRVAAVAPQSRLAGAHTCALDLTYLPAGTYLVRLTTDGRRRQTKLIVN